MTSITIHTGDHRSDILIGETIHSAGRRIPIDRTVIITDTNVWRFHSDRFPECPVIRIGTGEGIKTLDTVASIYEELIALEADRSVFLLGIGGGVVCDICGFVASTYLRGVRFGFAATTLLAQVDASVGGKNGVNFKGYKNMVGVFNQPEFVICDTAALDTLPKDELQCGLAEAVKHGAIFDADYFGFLEENAEAILHLDRNAIERVVSDSVRIKAAVVERDERESGERRKLNFGHTLGHALEKTLKISHGQAVSAGMVFAAQLSVHQKRLAGFEADRLTRLLERLGLPTVFPISGRQALEAMGKDKKRRQSSIYFVLLEAIGRAVVERMPLDELGRKLEDLIS